MAYPDDECVDADDVDETLADPDTFAGRLQRLTHLSLARIQSQFDGGRYQSKLEVVTPALLDAHLRGEVVLGFTVLEDGTSQGDALFGALDVDVKFEQRLPAFRDAIAAIGGSELANSVFLTTGSSDGRGKIVFTIERPTSSASVRALVQAVYRRALRDPRFGRMTEAGEVEIRPLGGTGGLLRILGRNAGKDAPGFRAPIEQALTLDGDLCDLVNVRPLSIVQLERLARDHRAAQTNADAWLEAWLSEAWVYRREEGNTAGVFRRMIALARAAHERYGDAGAAEFRAWCSSVARNSPALDAPSPTNRDRRNPLRTESSLRRAWRYATTRADEFVAPQFRGSGIPPELARIYEVLYAFVRTRGLSPNCFAMNYGFLHVELLGGEGHKKTVWKRVRQLEKRGLIVIHDPGLPMQRRDESGNGRIGLPTIMGLVGVGQTAESIRALVAENPKMCARLANRERDRQALLAPSRARRLRAV